MPALWHDHLLNLLRQLGIRFHLLVYLCDKTNKELHTVRSEIFFYGSMLVGTKKIITYKVGLHTFT